MLKSQAVFSKSYSQLVNFFYETSANALPRFRGAEQSIRNALRVTLIPCVNKPKGCVPVK